MASDPAAGALCSPLLRSELTLHRPSYAMLDHYDAFSPSSRQRRSWSSPPLLSPLSCTWCAPSRTPQSMHSVLAQVMNYTVGREWHGAAFTFLIQPIGIGLERLFSPLLRQRLGLPSWIGYFWTLAWILTTCAPFECVRSSGVDLIPTMSWPHRFEAIRAGYWSSDRASTTVFGRSEAFMASL